MDPSGDRGGGLTTAGLFCGSCGTELPSNSKFCSECGTPFKQAAQSAEYKQVTVLFADVVHSMDIAAAVGPERLREIMADLLDRSTAVVTRYGGTLSQFTGDGIMAVFGAPVALADHAVRACMAAIGVQEEAKLLAVDVQECDGVELQLRIGLNSGQVIAGEIGSGPFGYTDVGEQIGMASRSWWCTVTDRWPAAASARRRLAYDRARARSSGRCSHATASQPVNHAAARAA